MGYEENKTNTESEKKEEREMIKTERSEVYATVRDLYKHYVNYLLVIVIATSAVVGFVFQFHKERSFTTDNAIIISIYALIPLLIASWGGGLIYLNIEFWAYRRYLEYLEKIEIKNTDFVKLHTNIFREIIYSTPVEGISLTNQLNMIIVCYPIFIGLGSLFVFCICINKISSCYLPFAVLYSFFIIFLYIKIINIKNTITKRIAKRYKNLD